MAGRTDRDELGVHAWSLVLRTHAALVPRLNRELERERNMPLAWYDVLLELNGAAGRRLRMQDLGNRVVLSRSRASRVVDELEAVGLVVREPDPDDRRGSFAVLTAKGREALRGAAPAYLAAIAEQFTAHLTAAELHVLVRALGKVVGAQEAG